MSRVIANMSHSSTAVSIVDRTVSFEEIGAGLRPLASVIVE